MDRASQVLVWGVLSGVPILYYTLVYYGNILYSIFYYCVCGRLSTKEKT